MTECKRENITEVRNREKGIVFKTKGREEETKTMGKEKGI